MKKRIKDLIILYMMVTMVFLPLNVLGASSVTIEINTRETLTREDLEGRTLGIWKINDKFIDTNMDKTKLASILDKLSEEELDEQLADKRDKWVISPKEKDDYKVTLDLEVGTYYIRELGGKDRKTFIESAVFSPEETNIIKLKWGERENPPENPPHKPPHNPPQVPPENPPHEPPTPPNSVLLFKTDDEGRGLKGAKFQLTRDNGEIVRTSNFVMDDKGVEEVFETDDEGYILIKGLEPGVYFFKEIEAPKGYEIVTPESQFSIFSGGKARLTVVNKKKRGSYNFFKTDESKEKGLPGAEFVITRQVDGKDQRLKHKGEDLVLNSGEDGKFFVKDLPYGTYYIWETKAPSGYTLLQGSLKFEIDDNSSEKVLIIENTKRPPIPKTGDITLIVLVIAGAIMIGLGRFMIKDKN
ncbi:MSCRAMM family protein [Peptoniphilus porci]|uniref:Cell surface protein n=1 Tax=Peptoniphilus porci TaxID=2652280 RepID=A0A1U7M174_9FIRM|nr:SpaA isopeptide-forming pilin-related protein [Peptoniphilus porci]OLR65421.1 cell surface protein [Peptoniphilus porci]